MINFSSDNFTYNVDFHHFPSYSSKSWEYLEYNAMHYCRQTLKEYYKFSE